MRILLLFRPAAVVILLCYRLRHWSQVPLPPVHTPLQQQTRYARRHLVWHPLHADIVFVANELDNSISMCSWDAAALRLTVTCSLPLLPLSCKQQVPAVPSTPNQRPAILFCKPIPRDPLSFARSSVRCRCNCDVVGWTARICLGQRPRVGTKLHQPFCIRERRRQQQLAAAGHHPLPRLLPSGHGTHTYSRHLHAL